jgi:hypothetical protein
LLLLLLLLLPLRLLLLLLPQPPFLSRQLYRALLLHQLVSALLFALLPFSPAPPPHSSLLRREQSKHFGCVVLRIEEVDKR